MSNIPNTPSGYNPNAVENTLQVIFTNQYALNGILGNLGGNTVTQGMFVSKANATANDNTFVLPTAASVAAGNVWLITEGLIPDNLGVNSVQGGLNTALPTFGIGDSVNVVPVLQNGALMQLQVNFPVSYTVAVNAPLYIDADGYANPVLADAVAPYSIGYIIGSDTVTTTGAAVGSAQAISVFMAQNFAPATATYLLVSSNASLANAQLGLTAAALAAINFVLSAGPVPASLTAADVLTAGSGITVTPGSGTVTVAAP